MDSMEPAAPSKMGAPSWISTNSMDWEDDTPVQPNTLALLNQDNHNTNSTQADTSSATSGTLGFNQAPHLSTSFSEPANTGYGSPTKVTKKNTSTHVFRDLGRQATISNSSTFEFNIPLHLVRLGIRKKGAFIRLLVYCVPDGQVKLIWDGDRGALDMEYLTSIPDSTLIEYYNHIKSSLQTHFSTWKGFRPILDKGRGYTKYSAREDWLMIVDSIL